MLDFLRRPVAPRRDSLLIFCRHTGSIARGSYSGQPTRLLRSSAAPGADRRELDDTEDAVVGNEPEPKKCGRNPDS
jgi:hypothetical protein